MKINKFSGPIAQLVRASDSSKGDSLERSKDAKWMNSVKPNSKDKAIPNQAEDTSSEGVETSGEVKSS